MYIDVFTSTTLIVKMCVNAAIDIIISIHTVMSHFGAIKYT